jgi:hypothetical protein
MRWILLLFLALPACSDDDFVTRDIAMPHDLAVPVQDLASPPVDGGTD